MEKKIVRGNREKKTHMCREKLGKEAAGYRSTEREIQQICKLEGYKRHHTDQTVGALQEIPEQKRLR